MRLSPSPVTNLFLYLLVLFFISGLSETKIKHTGSGCNRVFLQARIFTCISLFLHLFRDRKTAENVLGQPLSSFQSKAHQGRVCTCCSKIMRCNGFMVCFHWKMEIDFRKFRQLRHFMPPTKHFQYLLCALSALC